MTPVAAVVALVVTVAVVCNSSCSDVTFVTMTGGAVVSFVVATPVAAVVALVVTPVAFVMSLL